MALKEQLDNDLKAALLERRRFVADTLRNVKAAILNEEVALGRRDDGLSDSEIEAVIAREIKKRHESLAVYEQNNRQELADVERQEIDVLSVYLPEQATEAELQAAIAEIIATIDQPDMKAMGQVVAGVKARFGTAADGATVARLVKATLQNEQ